MGARRYRAPKDDNTLDYFYKDIEGDGTKENPDKSGVIIRPNEITGELSDLPNKDGNLLEVLRYIANNLITGNNNSVANKDGDLFAILKFISNNLVLNSSNSVANKDGDVLSILKYISNNLALNTNNSTANKNGDLLAILKFISNNLVLNSSDVVANKDGDVLAVLRYIANNLAVNTNNSIANKDGDILGVLRFISNNLSSLSSQNKSTKPTTVTAKSVTTSLATIFDVVTANHDQLSLRLQNTGSVALNALEIQGFESEDFNDYQVLASTSANYTTQNGRQTNNTIIPVVDAYGVFPGIPGNQGKAGILLNVRFYQRIRLQASVASGTTTMSIGGTLMC